MDCWMEIDSGASCHLPQGRCGLKLKWAGSFLISTLSPSARKVWIEIPSVSPYVSDARRHLPQGRCGLK